MRVKGRTVSTFAFPVLVTLLISTWIKTLYTEFTAGLFEALSALLLTSISPLIHGERGGSTDLKC